MENIHYEKVIMGFHFFRTHINLFLFCVSVNFIISFYLFERQIETDRLGREQLSASSLPRCPQVTGPIAGEARRLEPGSGLSHQW